MLSYKRDTYCGQVTEALAGKEVHLSGWVQRARDLGGVVFVWLRDREGLVQLVFDEAVCSHEVFELSRSLRSEYVVTCTGEVRMRAENAVNPRPAHRQGGGVRARMRTAQQKRDAAHLHRRQGRENETVRLKYRYLDLRKPSLQRNLRMRAKIASAVRAYMDGQGFAEVETPVLTKSTPEGARDFLVPSRLHPGSFYALPQSPQIYKQLLMLAGFDKYYQVARCFRDEDNRADRQPEFTQVDVEMSFIDEKDIQTVIEGAFQRVFHDVMGMDIQLPLERITWREAMENYAATSPTGASACF